MVVLLNGAFGIGKTTVARLVSKLIPNTAIFDPELPGFVLQRALKLVGRPVEDFQDIDLWRRLVVLGIQATTKVRANVIVPMAFSNPSYLKEVQTGVAQFERSVVHICLVAPVEIVHERLRLRGEGGTDPKSAWQYRRAGECCVAHGESAFAEHLPTANLTAQQVANLVVVRLRHEHGAANSYCNRS